MKSVVENLNPTRVKLSVEVPFAELKPSMDDAYRSIAQQINIPGFRKGKVPPPVIDQRVGRGTVIQEALGNAVPDFYAKAVEENTIKALGQPEVEITEVPDPQQGGELKFTAEVDVRPEISLPTYSDLKVTVDDKDIADNALDEQLDLLRGRFATSKEVDRAAQDTDSVNIDLTATIDGDQVDEAKGITYIIGSGGMLEGLDENLTGKKAGDDVTFQAPLLGGPRMGDLADIAVVINTVNERTLPDADDDFAQLASPFDTIEELRAEMDKQIKEQAVLQQGLQAREKVLAALVEAVDLPLPEKLVAEQVAHQLSHNEGDIDDEERAEVTKKVEESIRQQLILDELVSVHEVPVTEQELIEYLVALAPQYGMEPQQFANAVEQSGQIQNMVVEVARRKALAIVLGEAKVTDSEGDVDLTAFLTAPGSDDSEEEVAAEEQSTARADDPTAVRF